MLVSLDSFDALSAILGWKYSLGRLGSPLPTTCSASWAHAVHQLAEADIKLDSSRQQGEHLRAAPPTSMSNSRYMMDTR